MIFDIRHRKMKCLIVLESSIRIFKNNKNLDSIFLTHDIVEFCTNTFASLHFLHNQIILCGFVRAKSHPPRNFFREKKKESTRLLLGYLYFAFY